MAEPSQPIPDRYLHHRRSLRLREYDYSWPGWYFVTVCTKRRECSFGWIFGNEIRLTMPGEIIMQTWEGLTRHFPTVELDAYVVMPNHMHGILILGDNPRLINQTPTVEKSKHEWIMMKNPDLTLGKTIRHFKAKSTRLIHDAGYTGVGWQRNYYEHIVRNANDLHWVLNEENRGFKRVHTKSYSDV